MLHLMHHHPVRWAANFVCNAVAEVETAAEQCTTRGHQLSTLAIIEGLVALRCYYNLDIASTQVDWIYETYKHLIQHDICSSRRLSTKELGTLLQH